MNYSKPELIQLGRATDAVQSVLEKGSREWIACKASLS